MRAVFFALAILFFAAEIILGVICADLKPFYRIVLFLLIVASYFFGFIFLWHAVLD